jgi:glycosyltransferase involved in cell wall biosynthesis
MFPVSLSDRIKGLFGFFNPSRKLGRIAFNMFPAQGPWGGSSTFVLQLKAFLEWRGFKVGFKLDPDLDMIVLIDPRPDLQNKSFGMDEIKKVKKENPAIKVLHRINECDQRKATSFMDGLLSEANAMADHTVFISEWLRDYHTQRWFDPERPHSVIYNGADPRIFHPIGTAGYTGSGTFRLVTHHWSDNPMKGFPLYQEVDELITHGEIPETELWVIGRWPEAISWKSAKTFPATHGRALAEKLRSCQAYLTASLWEPCGMHHVEGAQCGLPLIYHEDGGGIVEAGLKYGIGFRENVKEAIGIMKKNYSPYRDRLLKQIPSGDRMCLAYVEIIQRCLSQCSR